MENRLTPNVLVVDDNPLHQELMKHLLRILGYRAVIVRSGEEAVEAISKDNFVIVLTDVAMPGMDGLETARQIRKITGYEEPWIIAVSAMKWPNAYNECLAAGMNDYMLKPVTLDDLRNTLARYEAPLASATS
ncbi:MAG: response regulator [Rhodothermales bacterium]